VALGAALSLLAREEPASLQEPELSLATNQRVAEPLRPAAAGVGITIRRAPSVLWRIAEDRVGAEVQGALRAVRK
jgi:hypothetical protein